MYRTLRTAAKAAADTTAIVLFTPITKLPDHYAKLDRDTAGELSALLKRAEFSAERAAVTTLYTNSGKKRIIVAGLGDPAKTPTTDALRIAGAAIAKAAFKAQATTLTLDIHAAGTSPAEIGNALGEGIALANFTFDAFKKKDPKAGKPIDLTIAAAAPLRAGVDRALKVSASANISRTLAATPPNIANPDYLVTHCKKMAKQVGLKCSVIDAKRAKQLGMGGLVAVGAGGSTPPALITLEWPGKSNSKSTKPILLVGKAITFDTGGYSIKPADSMPGMKYDKCGGMAVIGAMHAIASLKLKQRVVALIPAAENMVDTDAYRPSDIIRFCNGVTCEVTNTDAEGRLVLADALAYGCKTYKPKAIVDLATLTGGVVVALGSFCAGCFCGDTDLRSNLFDAGDATGERLWHLPLWEEHKDLIKSNHADIVNSGLREAHPIQGAAFLSYFVDKDIPWAHLDIAGVADTKADGPIFTKGPTAFGVRLLTRWIESL